MELARALLGLGVAVGDKAEGGEHELGGGDGGADRPAHVDEGVGGTAAAAHPEEGDERQRKHGGRVHKQQRQRPPRRPLPSTFHCFLGSAAPHVRLAARHVHLRRLPAHKVKAAHATPATRAVQTTSRPTTLKHIF